MLDAARFGGQRGAKEKSSKYDTRIIVSGHSSIREVENMKE